MQGLYDSDKLPIVPYGVLQEVKASGPGQWSNDHAWLREQLEQVTEALVTADLEIWLSEDPFDMRSHYTVHVAQTDTPGRFSSCSVKPLTVVLASPAIRSLRVLVLELRALVRYMEARVSRRT